MRFFHKTHLLRNKIIFRKRTFSTSKSRKKLEIFRQTSADFLFLDIHFGICYTASTDKPKEALSWQRNFRNIKKKLIVRSICDERGLAFCATAKTLPNGEFGMVLIAQNQNTLFIHDTNMKSEALDLLYTIDLKKVTDLKINGFFGELFKGYSMRFTYKQFTYTLKIVMHASAN